MLTIGEALGFVRRTIRGRRKLRKGPHLLPLLVRDRTGLSPNPLRSNLRRYLEQQRSEKFDKLRRRQNLSRICSLDPSFRE